MNTAGAISRTGASDPRPLGLHGPLFLAWLALLVGVGERLARVLAAGPLVYALDDPYIHMAMAKHMAAAGVWGVGAEAFSSSSSSPLWTLLLTLATTVFGPREALPLILNIIFATAAVWVLDRWLREAGLGALGRLVALMAFVFCSPLPAVVFCGLEHSLQILLVLMFLRILPRYLGREAPALPGWRICLLGALLAACRYEDLFVVLAGCVLLSLAARRRLALSLGLSAGLPLLGYGILCLAHGWHLVPTSILVKAALPKWTDFPSIVYSLGGRALTLLAQRSQVAGLLVLALALRLVEAVGAEDPQAQDRRGWFEPTVCIFTCTALLHYQFAGTGWFYRYEAYLTAMGIAALALWAAERGAARRGETTVGFQVRLRRYWPAVILVILAAHSLVVQGARSYYEIGLATKNIREQHLQTARFIRRYYPDAAVALNDIGTTSFFTDAKVLDLTGLGDIEVARARLQDRLTRDSLYALAAKRGVRIAIVNREWFTQVIPPEWQEVGRLSIRDCVVGGPTVSLLAVAPDERGPLRQHLMEFVPSLPTGVMVQLARD